EGRSRSSCATAARSRRTRITSTACGTASFSGTDSFKGGAGASSALRATARLTPRGRTRASAPPFKKASSWRRQSIEQAPTSGIASPPRQLAAQIVLHVALHVIRRSAAAEEVIQLRQRCLGGHIEAADHAGARERGTGCVFGQVHRALEALRAIDDHH